MMERLMQLCERRGIRYIIVDTKDILHDTAVYSSKLNALFASEYLSVESSQVIIDLLEGGASA